MYQRIFIGKKVIRLTEVDSTNIYLQQLITNGKNELEGLVVLTENQYAGKGQRGNVWLSEVGKNLTFSILLKPNLLIQNQFVISKVVSLGLFDFLNHLGIKNVKIKWPNDIYVGEKKIAGILIENSVRESKIYNSVVGIGLNVNQSNFESISAVTSLINELKSTSLKLDELLAELLFFIEKRYVKVMEHQLTEIENDYVNQLYRLKEDRNFIIDNKNVVGQIIGVNPIGKLLLKINNKTEEFDLKEIKFT